MSDALGTAAAGPVAFTTRPELVGTFGMVASTHWLASAAGMRVLERGGNAFDAAVAAGLVLQVVEPHLNGPGGDLALLMWSARERRVRVLCGQGVAPAAATIARFRALDLDLVPGTGLLAACVPGAFDAWMRLLRDYGTISVAEAFELAIGYAETGFPVVAQIAGAIASVEVTFRSDWPTSAEIYLGDGVPRAGTQLRNPALAATYRRIVRVAERAGGSREAQIDAARACFYRGFVAEAIGEFLATAEVKDSSGRRHRGLLSAGDLAAWEATYEDPVALDYGGLTVCKTGPWGQGPVLLAQLSLLAGFDLAALRRDMAAYVHTIVECAKLAFADREAWYGDPAHYAGGGARLRGRGLADERRALVGDTASLDLRPGSPDGRAPLLAAPAAPPTGAEGVGEPTGLQIGDTCHVDVVDRDGNAVSATPSGGWLQSSPVVPGLGFPLGTRAQMFWLQDGLAASLVPGARPRTTLSPTLALRDGELHLSLGTPGGDQQDEWQLHVLLGHLHGGLNLQAAIDAPQFHSLHAPSSFFPRHAQPGRIEVEARLPAAVIAGLRERGHDVEVRGPWTLGRVSAVSRDADGVLRAGANPRGMQGYAAGR